MWRKVECFGLNFFTNKIYVSVVNLWIFFHKCGIMSLEIHFLLFFTINEGTELCKLEGIINSNLNGYNCLFIFPNRAIHLIKKISLNKSSHLMIVNSKERFLFCFFSSYRGERI